MFDVVAIENVAIVEIRATGVLCVVRGRTLEVPLEALWDEGEELVAGQVCELEVRRSWARENGLGR